MKKYRAGIIGLGRVGAQWDDSHFNAYLKHPRIELVALCDLNPHEEFYSFQDYQDYLEMVKLENLDIVSVCTPPSTHCQIICGIAPYVKGIYCEKPIAETLEDADKMILTCREHNVKLQINHQRRWNTPVFTFSRGILNSGTHAFDTINYYFKEDKAIKFVYVETDEPIFKLEFPAEPHVPSEAIDELIECIEYDIESTSSGEEATIALQQCLDMQKSNIIKVGKRKYLKLI
jgi:hypothetical protein